MRGSQLVLLLMLLLAAVVQAKRAASVSSMDELWTFFVVVNTCVFLPVLLYFLVMFARDPASQELLMLVWTYAKHKTMGFLSPADSRSNTKQRRPLVGQQPKPKPTATTSRRSKRQA